MIAPGQSSPITKAELKLLQALVYQECGMYFDERRTHFLEDRLSRRLKECRIDSFYNYYRLLLSDQGRGELSRLVEDLTVNETSFFRNQAQLELFHKHVLEELRSSLGKCPVCQQGRMIVVEVLAPTGYGPLFDTS